MTFKTLLKNFWDDTRGTTLVEFAMCIGLFLLILFAVLDFGRLGYNWVMTEKAMQRAVRIAAVRPPVCANVPFYHRRSATDTSTLEPGDRCSASAGLCEDVVRQCRLSQALAGTLAEGTANEIWQNIQVLLPNGATRENILIEYVQDDNLGFLGGPFTPNVNVELVGVNNGDFCFEFITPLSALAATVGPDRSDADLFNDADGCTGAQIPFPAIAVNLPAEDMNIGNDG
jgi:Flp pilus assembly pilin Flp